MHERIVERDGELASALPAIEQGADASVIRRIRQADVNFRPLATPLDAEVDPAAHRKRPDQRKVEVRDERVDFVAFFFIARQRRTHDDFTADAERSGGIVETRAAYERE